ncbi:MAG: OmpH family outer membrane protein [Deltaproteobacteria bacterium]|jgi:outer membrane protein|nr:OmpH family outer membrane protein [Deltaproteobacteria bacterium]
MRKTILLVFAFCLFAVTAQAAELKIGLFNMEEVARSSDAVKENNKNLENTFGKERSAIEKTQKDLQDKFDAFSKQQAGLSAEAREERQATLIREKRDFDDRANAFQRKVTAAESRYREQVVRCIFLAVSDYGKKNSFSLILDANSAGAIHVAPALDITGAILKEANRVWKEKPKALNDGSPIITGADSR